MSVVWRDPELEKRPNHHSRDLNVRLVAIGGELPPSKELEEFGSGISPLPNQGTIPLVEASEDSGRGSSRKDKCESE